MLKKVIYIAMSVFLCFIFIPKSVSAFPSEDQMDQINSVTVHTKIEQGRKKCFEYELKIPVFHLKNKIFQKKLNTYFKGAMFTSKNDVQQYYEKYGDMELDCKEGEPTHFSKTNYKVTYNKTPIVSLYLLYNEYIGAAHEFLELEGKTYDVSTSQEIRLEDLFIKNSQYLSIIRKEIVQQIKRGNIKYYPSAEKIINNQKEFLFFLEPKHLVIYFQPYEIAAFYVDFPEFRIPYSTLKNELNPKYRATLVDY